MRDSGKAAQLIPTKEPLTGTTVMNIASDYSLSRTALTGDKDIEFTSAIRQDF